MRPALRSNLGFSLLEITIALAIGSSILLVAMQLHSVLQGARLVNNGAQALELVKNKSLRYFASSGAFPARLSELDFVADNPWQSQMLLEQSAEGIRISLNLANSQLAQKVSRQLANSETIGKKVSIVVYKPIQNIQNDFALHRVKVDGKPELNRMETALQMNQFDISDVGALHAQSIVATEAEFTDLEASTAEFDSMLISGSAQIETLKAESIEGSEIEAQWLTADYAEVQEITISQAHIETLEADEIDVGTLTANTVTADNLETQSLDADSISAQDFITSEGKFSEFLQRLDILETAWDACVDRNGCR